MTAPAAPLTPDVPDAPRKRAASVAVYVGAPVGDRTAADAIDVLSRALTPLGFVGTVIDGEHLGAPGLVVACTIGFGDGRVMRWIEAPDGSELRPDLTWDEVRGAAEQALGAGVQVGRYVVVGDEVFPGGANWVPRVSGLRPREVVVGPYKRTDAPMLAGPARGALRAVWVEPALIVEAADPDDDRVDLERVVQWSNKGTNLLLWRAGPWQGFLAQRRGRGIAHTWGPEWQAIDPSGRGTDDDAVADVVGILRMPRASEGPLAEILADHLGMEGTRRTDLLALLAQESPTTPIPRLLALVDLPAVAATILDDPTAMAALPDAYVYEKKGILKAAFDDRGLPPAGGPTTQTSAATPRQLSSQSIAGSEDLPPDRRGWEWPEGWVRSRLRKALIVPVFTFAAWYFFSVGATTRAWVMVGMGVVSLLYALFSSEAKSKPTRDNAD